MVLYSFSLVWYFGQLRFISAVHAQIDYVYSCRKLLTSKKTSGPKVTNQGMHCCVLAVALFF